MKLPEHVSLWIQHNEHRSVYESIEQYVMHLDCDWIDEDDMQKCIATNEIWEATWFHQAPGGAHYVAASSLELLLNKINSGEYV